MGMENEKEQVVDGRIERTTWEDRKHHLWFPLSFTKYSVDGERLYVNSGLLKSREDECLLYRILDISMTRTLAQRIFGTGTIEMNTKDRSTPLLKLENIKNPGEVKRMLSDLIEKERREKNVVGRDMVGAASHIDMEELHEMPDFDDDIDFDH